MPLNLLCLSQVECILSWCLPTVAKGRSLFADASTDIQELTQVIKQDLAKLNSDIAELQQQVKARSHRDSRHVHNHSSSVVVSLQVRGGGGTSGAGELVAGSF